jgi:hypothetical protein
LSVEDVVITPNIAFLSAIGNVKEIGYFAELGLKTAITALKPKEFQKLTIKQLLFGFEDQMINLISKFRWDVSPKDVCLLGYRDGVLKRKFTVTRGINDINGLGQFFAIDGKTHDTMWTTEKCNRIHGSDIAFYNSSALHKKDIIYMYPPEIHRSLPIIFVEKVKYFDLCEI